MPAPHKQNHVYAVVSLLVSHDYTIPELSATLGTGMETARRIVKQLRDAGALHIVGYRRMSDKQGAQAPVWRLGKGIDAKKPSAKTARERMDAYLERKNEVARLGIWGL